MNIIPVLTFCTLLLLIQGTQYHEGYYAGFTDVLGVDAFSTNDGIDCTEPVNRALHQFRDNISFGNRDSKIFLQAAADLIDKLKFEVSPLCRTFYGDFNDFMSDYYGDVEQIKIIADRNLVDHSSLIEKVVRDSLTALQLGDDYETGKGHAYLLKLLFDLEKSEEKTINTTQEVQEPAKEEIVKVEQTVEEKVQDVKVEPVVTVVNEVTLSLDEERIVALTEDVVIKEEDVEPVKEDAQINGTEFNEHMDYDYAEITGVATEEKTDEDAYEAEVETMMSQDESEIEDEEEEDEEDQDKDEDEEMEEDEEDEDEEDEDEEVFSTNDDEKVEVVEREAQVEEEEEEDSDQDELDDDVIVSLSQYDSEVNAVQKRVLSQDYQYNYDL